MYTINQDGTISLNNKYRVLWSVFKNTKPYTRIQTIPFTSKTPIPDAVEIPSNEIIELPENFNITLEFLEETRVSIYRVNLQNKRLEISCSRDNIFLKNKKISRVVLGPECRYIYIHASRNAVASFSIPMLENFPFERDEYGSKNICINNNGEKSPIVAITRIPETNNFIDSTFPAFALVQYYVRNTYNITSLPIPRKYSETKLHVNCSGNLLFDTLNNTLWSITSGQYKTAKRLDGKCEGILLDGGDFNVDFEVNIQVEGKFPRFRAYLKCKSAPGIYHTHEDIHGKPCETELVLQSDGSFRSDVWKLGYQAYSNVILYIEAKDYSSDVTNLDIASYSLNVN